jgi:hypothetical protein
MVDMATCRRLLGKDCPLSDTEIEALRGSLYVFADIVISSISPLGFVDPEDAR